MVKCPNCGADLDRIELSLEYAWCPKCGYQEKAFTIDATGKIVLGALVGAVIGYAIATLLEKK